MQYKNAAAHTDTVAAISSLKTVPYIGEARRVEPRKS